MPAPHLLGKTRQRNQLSPLLLSQHGHSSAHPTHLACGSFTVAVGEKVREGRVRVFEQMLLGDLDSWSQGCESLESLLLGIDAALLPNPANSPVDQALLWASTGWPLGNVLPASFVFCLLATPSQWEVPGGHWETGGERGK